MRDGSDTPHPLDVSLGARVRLRRKELGLSQSGLADAIGITFQQVQKYEHGTNRISFSRLVEMAHALKSTVADLIGPLDSPRGSASLSRQIKQLTEPGACDLLQAYASITSSKKRHAILNMARQLAPDQPGERRREARSSRPTERTSRRSR